MPVLFIYDRLVVSPEEAQNKDSRSFVKAILIKVTDLLVKAKVLFLVALTFFANGATCYDDKLTIQACFFLSLCRLLVHCLLVLGRIPSTHHRFLWCQWCHQEWLDSEEMGLKEQEYCPWEMVGARFQWMKMLANCLKLVQLFLLALSSGC